MVRPVVVPSSSRDVFVGRRSELDTLSRLHDEAGPRVLFVHGLAGSGKSCLVHRFAQRYAAGDPLLVVVDCRAVEPTEQGFLAAVADHVRGFAHLDDGPDAESLGVLDRLGGLRRRVVVCLDHYEVFRLLDTWLRLVVVPALPPNVALLIAGREEPHPAWRRLPAGTLEAICLGPLPLEDSRELVRSLGVASDEAAVITRFAGAIPSRWCSAR